MTKIKSSDLPSSDRVSPACIKYHKPLSKKKKKSVDMDAIGTPANNLLLDLMRCQVKHPNINGGSDGKRGGSDAKECVKAEKIYSACHAAVMGVGNFKGRKHCGDEMEQLFLCVSPGASLS
eukprot:CAMPEP_0172536216 /NCGR_PEP_ID=MMETSP1067-20121228/8017_1 /TAXON_ID=265564 ORGANISM="Thalassiosira punctigera, Strain Tpunct2005C2" /NCGR_SAMPLE_ID=MMETSP1067 /ASSEMBLY_ACC=CAM_ASM_000444 /LENGTH=120 /DNA_ID=CAMNT_0013321245 /DNA_START=100 /DNA_END=462 /DNA_ORIENTATION=-